jgi:hypothetical protein
VARDLTVDRLVWAWLRLLRLQPAGEAARA